MRGNSGSNQKLLKKKDSVESDVADFGEWTQVFASVSSDNRKDAETQRDRDKAWTFFHVRSHQEDSKHENPLS